MSEHLDRVPVQAVGSTRTGVSALVHAGEVAQWTLILLGWLWLGEQGMRLGWSLVGGVLPVAVWWAARLLSRGRTWALQASPLGMGLLGLFTACGVAWPGFVMDPDAAHASLLVVALLWGIWCGVVESRSQASTFTLGTLAWHPVVAAALAYLAWRLPGLWPSASWGVSTVLACCAAAFFVRDRWAVRAPALCRGVQATGATVLPASAMGLMMGSLWLGNAWCVGLNLSLPEMVTAHLALMAVLPAAVSLLGRLWAPGGDAVMSSRSGHLALACLALGPWMFLGDTALHGVLAMLLPSLAWALHVGRHRTPWASRVRWAPEAVRGLALLLGPVLLVWVGWLSPSQGPQAAQSALALLGVLAALQLAQALWRAPVAWGARLRSKT